MSWRPRRPVDDEFMRRPMMSLASWVEHGSDGSVVKVGVEIHNRPIGGLKLLLLAEG